MKQTKQPKSASEELCKKFYCKLLSIKNWLRLVWMLGGIPNGKVSGHKYREIEHNTPTKKGYKSVLKCEICGKESVGYSEKPLNY